MTVLAERPAELSAQQGEGAVEAATTSPPVMPARSRRWPRRILSGLLVLAALGSMTVAALALRAVHSRDAVATARGEAAAAARIEATAMTSYDYRTIDADFAAVTAHATGTFRTDFATTSAKLAPMVTKSKAVAKGTVRDVAVEQATRNAATVLVFVDQTVTGTDQSLTSRLRMTLVRDHGRWLVSAVDLV